MMRTLLLSALLCSSALTLQAQPLTLTRDNFIPLAPGDRIGWQVAAATSWTLPAEGENQVWDYSGLVAEGTPSYAEPQQPDNAAYPTADYYFTSYYGVGSFSIEGQLYHEVNDDGVFTLGRHYLGTTFDLSGMGTLTVPTQSSPFTEKVPSLKFPMTYGSEWTHEARTTLNTTLDVPPFVPNQPAQNVHITMDSTTVVGWGTLMLPGNVSHPALLVKHRLMTVDSFYIAGQPASPQILAALGLQQADTTYQWEYSFRTVNLKGELLVFEMVTADGEDYGWASYRSDLATTNVAEQTGGSNPRLYPNPVSGNTTTLAFEKTSAAPWTVAVYNTAGQVAGTWTVAQPAGSVQFELPVGAALSAGSYTYDIRNERGQHVHSGTMIVVR